MNRIDIFVDGVYEVSTTRARTLEEAIANYKADNGGGGEITAEIADPSKDIIKTIGAST